MTTLERIQEFDFVQKSLEINNTPFSLFGVECEEGWSDLLYKLCQDLQSIGFNGHIAQIKEKFGTLRFYVDDASEKIYELIEQAENLSAHTCEICGKLGVYKVVRGWCMTRCDEHTPEEKSDGSEN